MAVEEEQIEIEEGVRFNQEAPEPVEESQEDEPTMEEDVTPEDEPEGTPEEDAESVEDTQPEGAEEEPEAQVEVNENGKPYYTPDEMLALRQAGEDGKYPKIDTSRIKPNTPEWATMKAMEASFTPKLQEGAEIRKQYESLEQQIKAMQQQQQQAQEPQQPKTWDDALRADPIGTMRHIDALIAQETKSDPYGEKIAEYRTIKDGLSTAMFNMQHQQSAENFAIEQANNKARAAALEAVPDYLDNLEAYESFATERGISQDTLSFLTNAQLWESLGAPNAPIELLKLIASARNDIASLATPQKVVEKKAVKQPTKVEDAGAGDDEQAEEPEWSPSRSVNEMRKGRVTH
jgi:hypothetical protein